MGIGGRGYTHQLYIQATGLQNSHAILPWIPAVTQ